MKKSLFVVPLLVIAIATGLFMSQKIDSSETAQTDYTKKQPKAKRIQEALEWRYDLLKDPATGTFDVNMLYAAVNKANDLKNAATNKSGVLNLNWELMGPDNQGGRTRALIFDRNISDKLWAGSVGGGLFQSVDGGSNWTRVVTYDGFFPIASIAQASDGSLYVGTGEGLGNPLSSTGTGFNSQSGGNGIYKSSDNGLTWNVLPGTDAGHNPNILTPSCDWCGVNDIAVSPINDNIILAATEGGLKVSTQAGMDATWVSVPVVTGQGQSIEITQDGQTAFGAFNGRVYRSIDASSNFTTGWTLMPVTFGTRADVAIAPSNESYVYASVTGSNNCLSGLWRSTDSGDNWTEIQSGGSPYILDPFNQPSADFNACDGQGWYDQTIAVNPADENKVYVGGITLYTWGAGFGFKRADIIDTEQGDPFNSRYIHADKHEIIFNPQDPTGNQMLIGSDGGVTLCTNANSGFPDNLNFVQKNKGYATLQVYGMGAGAAGEVLSGNQDNGTQYINGLLSSDQAAQEVSGGDGVYAEISNLDPDVLFAGVYFGDLLRSVNRGASTNDFLDGNIDLGGCGKITCTNNANSCSQNFAPFIYPFYLMETSNVLNQDTTARLEARDDTLLLASGATQYVTDSIFPTHSITTTTTVGEEGTTVEKEEVQHLSYTFTSRVSDAITFERSIFQPLYPGETLFVEDPYDAKYFVPSTCGLWMCLNPISKGTEPVFYKISTVSNAKAFDASADGDILYFSVSNRLYIVEGLNLIHQTLDPLGCFNSTCAPALRIQQIATLPVAGEIQGVAVDKNDANTVLLTVSGFSNTGKVFRVNNATSTTLASITVDNLHVTDTYLPRMPIYDCIIDVLNPNKYIVSSELGIWTSDDAGQTWSEDNDGLFGRMPIYRLRQEWMYEEGCMVLYAGTHGGGMFRCTSLMAAGCDPEPFQWNKLSTPITPIKEVNKDNVSNISLYPNPVQAVSKLAFNLNSGADIKMSVVDVTGRVISTFNHNNLTAGEHVLDFNTASLNTGSYHLVLTSNGKLLGSKVFLKK